MPSAPAHPVRLPEKIFSGAVGVLFGVGLLKFGNPAIFEEKIAVPTTAGEWLSQAWPLAWAYGLLALLLGVGLFALRRKRPAPLWLWLLPLAWLGWQFIASAQSVSPALTHATLRHFTACIVCFYLGWGALAGVKNPRLLWLLVLAAFFWMLREGFVQHFGGLEATRRYFEMYVLPTLTTRTEEVEAFLRKMAKGRIFSTLFYPNTFAGAILLFLPALLVTVWNVTATLRPLVRTLGLIVLGGASAACLFWSGSKSGWLLALGLGVAALLHAPVTRRWKQMLVASVCLLGLAGFFLKYAGFFQQGATSVVARTDYWRAAVQIAQEKPLFGSGPGTFAIPYQKLKAPDAEMARLCHNDFLEQAADSGWLGAALYLAMIVGLLVKTYPRGAGLADLRLAVWLGLLVLNLQSLVEFHLYIPALAWPMFLLFGWLLGQQKRGTGNGE